MVTIDLILEIVINIDCFSFIQKAYEKFDNPLYSGTYLLCSVLCINVAF